MPLKTLENDALQIQVSPEAGASLVSCRRRFGQAWVDIMRPTPPEAIEAGNSSQMASFTLVPFSNRVRNARFNFGGKLRELKPNTPDGHTIHGDVRKRPWDVYRETRDVLSFGFDARNVRDRNFPFVYETVVSYELVGEALETRLTLTNVGYEPMPAGYGFHPYFRRNLGTEPEDLMLQAQVAGVYPELLPTTAAVPLKPEQDFSSRRALKETVFDHCFAGWDGIASIYWPRSRVEATIECSADFKHLILFTPKGESFFALEPVTHANDGFNLMTMDVPGHGVHVLAPGEAMSGRFRLNISTER